MNALPLSSPAVRLYELRLGWHQRGWVERRLVEAFEVQGAALEFGGAARCTDPAAGAAPEELAEGELAGLLLGAGGEAQPAAMPQ